MMQDAAVADRYAQARFGRELVLAPQNGAAAGRPESEAFPWARKKKHSPLPFIARCVGAAALTIAGLAAGAHYMPRSRPALVAANAPRMVMPTPHVHLDWAEDLRTAAARPAPVPVSASPIEAAEEMHKSQVRRSFLDMLTSALGAHSDTVQFGTVRVPRKIVEAILRAAKETDMDPVLLMAIADKESSFQPDVGARTSSAVGLFQFVDSTWLRVVRDFGARHGLKREAAMISAGDRPTVADAAARERILDMRRDPYLASVMAAEMLKRDGSRIAQNIGRNLTTGEIYLAHFLGPDDAERFMEKVVGQPKFLAARLLPKPARANASIFYARHGRHARPVSVAAVHDKFESMMDTRLDRYRSVAEMAGVEAYTDVVTR